MKVIRFEFKTITQWFQDQTVRAYGLRALGLSYHSRSAFLVEAF